MTRKIPNLAQRNGVFETRVQIPKDVQSAYGKTRDGGTHGTRDFNTALERHGPMVAAIRRRIETIRAGEKTDLGTSPKRAPKQPSLWSPDDAFAAIQNWAKSVIDKSYLEHFHGEAPVIAPLGDDAVALSDRALALSERRFGDIARFDEALVEALTGQGIDIALRHPAIPNLRGWFAEAWLSIENHSAKFRQGNFSQWSLAVTSGNAASEIASASKAMAAATHRTATLWPPSTTIRISSSAGRPVASSRNTQSSSAI